MEKIQFKYITEEGKYKCKTHKINTPKFESYKTDFKGIEFVVTKESQIMDFLDEMDKTDFMQENEIITIIDYKPFIQKKKQNKEIEILSIFSSFISNFKNKEQMYFDFVAVAAKMKDSIKNLSIKNQMNIILNALSVGYKAKTTALKELSDFRRNLDEDLSKLKTHDERLKYLNPKDKRKELSG